MTILSDEHRPAQPGLDYVFSIEADIERPLSLGRHSQGERLHIPIIGGIVSGPRLSGRVMAGGSDWPLIRPDGTSEITAQYTIVADDGTPIMVRNEGLRVSTPAVLAHLRAGEVVTPAEYYFRGAPRFDAPDGPHGWLRTTLFIASLAPRGTTIAIDIYAVT